MGSPTIFSGKYTKLLTQKGLLQQGGAVNQFDGPRNYIANSSLESGTLDGWNRVKTTITSNLPSGIPTIGKLISVAPSITAFSAFSGTAPFDTYGLRFGNILSTVVAGEGIISDAFTIEPGDLGKVLTFKLYYKSDLGASTDNWSGILGSQTWAVYIYDQTAGAWLQPAGFLGMNQNSGVGIVSGTFQSSVVSGQQYRIAVIALRNTTSTSALQIDNIYVGSQTAPIGPVVTDWVSYTPTGSWTSGVTSYTGRWRRVGDSAEFDVTVLCSGTVTAAALTVNLPSGMSIDTAKLSSTTFDVVHLGTARVLDSGIIEYGIGFVKYTSPTSVTAQTSNASGTFLTSPSVTNNAPMTFGANDTVQLSFRAPISGWASQVQLSNDTDTRVVAASGNFAGTSIPTQASEGSETRIEFLSTFIDTHASTTITSASKFTAPVSGIYKISAVLTDISSAGTFAVILKLFKNNAVAQNRFARSDGNASQNGISGSFMAYLNAGDFVDFRIFQNSGSAKTFGPSSTWSIERLSGPSVVAANETVAAGYWGNSAQSIPVGIDSVCVSTPSKVYDTHNMWSAGSGYNSGAGTWTTRPGFTIPVSGKYLITFSCGVSLPGSPTLGTLWSEVGHLRGASVVSTLAGNRLAGNFQDTFTSSGSGILNCQAGDFVGLFTFQSTGAARNTVAESRHTRIEIVRIGN